MAVLIEAVLLFNLGLIAVLVLRRPSQHLFGAHASYGWWALPWLLAGSSLAPTPLAPVLQVGNVAAPPLAQAVATAAGIPWLLPLWGAGLACCLLLALRSILRLRAQLRPTTQTIELAGRRLRVAHADFGPAVFGLWRPWLVLPEAAAATLSEHDQRLALAHEGAHLKLSSFRPGPRHRSRRAGNGRPRTEHAAAWDTHCPPRANTEHPGSDAEQRREPRGALKPTRDQANHPEPTTAVAPHPCRGMLAQPRRRSSI